MADHPKTIPPGSTVTIEFRFDGDGKFAESPEDAAKLLGYLRDVIAPKLKERAGEHGRRPPTKTDDVCVLKYTFTGPGNCRACEAPGLWFTTPKGKNMLVNDCPEAGNPADGRGMWQRGDTIDSATAQTVLLPNVHFATCPDADKFRGKRGRR